MLKVLECLLSLRSIGTVWFSAGQVFTTADGVCVTVTPPTGQKWQMNGLLPVNGRALAKVLKTRPQSISVNDGEVEVVTQKGQFTLLAEKTPYSTPCGGIGAEEKASLGLKALITSITQALMLVTNNGTVLDGVYFNFNDTLLVIGADEHQLGISNVCLTYTPVNRGDVIMRGSALRQILPVLKAISRGSKTPLRVSVSVTEAGTGRFVIPASTEAVGWEIDIPRIEGRYVDYEQFASDRRPADFTFSVSPRDILGILKEVEGVVKLSLSDRKLIISTPDGGYEEEVTHILGKGQATLFLNPELLAKGLKFVDGDFVEVSGVPHERTPTIIRLRAAGMDYYLMAMGYAFRPERNEK